MTPSTRAPLPDAASPNDDDIISLRGEHRGEGIGEESTKEKTADESGDLPKPAPAGAKAPPRTTLHVAPPCPDSVAATCGVSGAPVLSLAGPCLLLRGTISYDSQIRRQVIRGTWSWSEAATGHQPQQDEQQTFELIRNVKRGEDQMVMMESLRDGTYHGSFHAPSDGFKAPVRENGVRLEFALCGSEGGESYAMTGRGKNRLGRFRLHGCATRGGKQEAGAEALLPQYDVELWKEYIPASPVAPPTTRAAGVEAARSKAAGGQRKCKADEEHEPQGPENSACVTGCAGLARSKKRKTAEEKARAGALPADEVVTQSEFNRLGELIRNMQHQMSEISALLAELAAASTPSNKLPRQACQGQRKKDTHKQAKGELGTQNATQTKQVCALGGSKESPPLVAEEALALPEKQDIIKSISKIPAGPKLQDVARIIQGSASVDVRDCKEINIDLDRLDPSTQRRLFHFLLPKKKLKRNRKLTSGALPSKKARKAQAPPAPPSCSDLQQATRQRLCDKRSVPAPRFRSCPCSFMNFDNTDTEEDSDPECFGGEFTVPFSPTQQGQDAKDMIGVDDPWPSDGDTTDCEAAETNDWSVLKSTDKRPLARDASEDSGGLRATVLKDAALAKAQKAERQARLDRMRAGAVLASQQKLAESMARGAKLRADREAEESLLRQEAEREFEKESNAAREAIRAQVASVKQTVDLNPLLIRIPSGTFSFSELSASACASPSSDFGF